MNGTIKTAHILFEHEGSTFWIEELRLANNFKPNRIFQVDGFGLFNTKEDAIEAIKNENPLK